MSDTVELSSLLASHVGIEAMGKLRSFARWAKLATGGTVYVSGSALRTKAFRDVDMYVAYTDVDFNARYPQQGESWWFHCAAFGKLASDQTGLPVDFHIVNLTAMNAMNPRLVLT